MFRIFKKSNSSNGTPGESQTEAPREFTIGGLRVSFQKYRSDSCTVSVSGSQIEKRSIFKLIEDGILQYGKELRTISYRSKDMDIEFASDGTDEWQNGRGVAKKADILEVLESLQEQIKTWNDAEDRIKNIGKQSAELQKIHLRRWSLEATKTHYQGVLHYLESIGQPLSEDQQQGLREALAESHIKAVERSPRNT